MFKKEGRFLGCLKMEKVGKSKFTYEQYSREVNVIVMLLWRENVFIACTWGIQSGNETGGMERNVYWPVTEGDKNGCDRKKKLKLIIIQKKINVWMRDCCGSEINV